MDAAVSGRKKETKVVEKSPTTAYQKPGPASSKKATERTEDSSSKSKLNEIKQLIKKKKVQGFLKRRSIKWLNAKKNRDKYKLNVVELIRKCTEISQPMKKRILSDRKVNNSASSSRKEHKSSEEEEESSSSTSSTGKHCLIC